MLQALATFIIMGHHAASNVYRFLLFNSDSKYHPPHCPDVEEVHDSLVDKVQGHEEVPLVGLDYSSCLARPFLRWHLVGLRTRVS